MEVLVIQAYASCNGRYTGQTIQNRAIAARSTLDRGFRNLDGLTQLAHEKCPGAVANALAAATDPSPDIEPTPAHADVFVFTFINAYANCNGRYAGDAKMSRYSQMHASIINGHLTIESLEAITNRECSTPYHGPVTASLAPPTPAPTAPPTPQPTKSPTRQPTSSPTPQAPQPTRSHVAEHQATPVARAMTHPTRFTDVTNASWFASRHPSEADALKQLPWVKDGLTPLEAEIIEYLLYIAVRNQTEQVFAIIQMPLMRSPEPADLSAIKSLRRIANDAPAVFRRVMLHPTLANSITDSWAPVIAVLSSPAQNNPPLVDQLLDSTSVTLQTDSVHTPLSGQVSLAIVRLAPGPARSMQLLQHAVLAAEDFIGLPLPTGHVSLLFADAATAGYAGTNYNSHIVINQRYDVNDSSHDANALPSTIAHEVAHYYWSGNADWIDEGLANLHEAYAERLRDATPIQASRYPCPHYETIAALESAQPSKSDPGFTCNYSLGERLFIELYRHHGHQSFAQRLARLYHLSIPEDANPLPGTQLGIAQVRATFGGSPPADQIINRWYDGSIPYDASSLDLSAATNEIPNARATILLSQLSLAKDGTAVASFSLRNHQSQAFFTIKYSAKVGGGPHRVPLTLITYFEDGHQASRHTAHIEVAEQYNASTYTWHIPVGPHNMPWKPGRYWAMIYDRSQKAAQVQWDVTP